MSDLPLFNNDVNAASLERAQSRAVRPSSRASPVAGCRLIGNGRLPKSRFPSIVAFRASGK